MITIYGKPGCGKCDACKDKLERLGVPYHFVDLEAPGDDFRKNPGDVCDAMATYQLQQDLPLVGIAGTLYSYAAAMKEIKRRKRKQ